MNFIETLRLQYFDHLPLNMYRSVVCLAAVAVELGGTSIYLILLEIYFK
jgi:hypothetical protein